MKSSVFSVQIVTATEGESSSVAGAGGGSLRHAVRRPTSINIATPLSFIFMV
jgi:hypothetical protein